MVRAFFVDPDGPIGAFPELYVTFGSNVHLLSICQSQDLKVIKQGLDEIETAIFMWFSKLKIKFMWFSKLIFKFETT